MQIVHFAATTQVVNNILNKVQGFINRVTHAQAAAFAKIDDLGIQTIAHRPPLVFFEIFTAKDGYIHVVFMTPGELGDQSLAESCERKSIFNSCRHIANTKFEGIKKWMRPYIPPDFFAVIDALHLNKSLYVLIKIVPGSLNTWHTT